MTAATIAHVIAHTRGERPVLTGGDRVALCGITYQPRDLDPGLPLCAACAGALVGEYDKLARAMIWIVDSARSLIVEWERRDREGCGSDAKFGACAYELGVAFGLEDPA